MGANGTSPVATVRGLALVWGAQRVFEGLNFDVPPGVTLVTGEEQSGKTGLLRILSGELAPASGWVAVRGLRGDQQPAAYLSEVARPDPLDQSLDPLSAAQWHATLPARYPHFSERLWLELVDAFGLAPHIAKPMFMLSAGSRRKAGLCAAFAAGAPLTLIDQPFAALDLPSMRVLREVLVDFSSSQSRACVVADYEAPEGVTLAATVGLSPSD